jgi:hypothetical protein
MNHRRFLVAAAAVTVIAACESSVTNAPGADPTHPSLNSGGFGSGNRADSVGVESTQPGEDFETSAQADTTGRNSGGFGSGN